MAINLVDRCIRSWLALMLVLTTTSCAFHVQRAPADARRDVANALLSHLLEESPPKDRVVCINVFIGPVDTWDRLESTPTLQYLKARGISALDGSECVYIPPPADPAGDWSHYGEIIHSATGRPAANYNVRVVEVIGAHAALHGGFAFSRQHGGSCPYEGRQDGGRWVVRLPPNAVCAAM